jgi:hypothetical protein
MNIPSRAAVPTRMSPIPGLSGYVLVPLRESADSTLYRGQRHDDASPVLAVALSEQPSPQSVRRLVHEYPSPPPSFRSPPFLHCDGQRLSPRFGKGAFLDWHRSLGGRCFVCRRRSRRNRSRSLGSSLRRPDGRPALLCRGDNRPSTGRAHLSFRRRCRTYARGRLRVQFDRRRYRLSAGTRRFLCCRRNLKGLDCCG